MSVESTLRKGGLTDDQVRTYYRLGPKTRAVIWNLLFDAKGPIDFRSLLQEFHRGRKIPNPISVGEDFIPQPLPSVYDSKEGDEELARWLQRKLGGKRYEVETPSQKKAPRKVDLGKCEVQPAKEIGRDLDL